jgi:hypothetical protein
MVPPIPEPLAAIPIAKPFFVVKYVGIVATPVRKNALLPRPVQTRWAKMGCQRVEWRLFIMIPKIMTTPLAVTRRRG